ncbi:MAG: Hsp70 family protein, partial [Myxococcales bacterium]|nr:Hsp70 family protein [Myxococcales bacterium]
KVTITVGSGLNENDIQRMVDDAAKFEEEDKKRREVVENRNALEAMVLQTEKLMSENGDKIPADAKGEVEAAITAAKEALDSGDNDRILAAKETLTQSSHKMAQAMYGQGQGAPEGAPGGDAGQAGQEQADAGGDDGDVIDAEFEEKN